MTMTEAVRFYRNFGGYQPGPRRLGERGDKVPEFCPAPLSSASGGAFPLNLLMSGYPDVPNQSDQASAARQPLPTCLAQAVKQVVVVLWAIVGHSAARDGLEIRR